MIHSHTPSGPYMRQLRELLDAMELWNYAHDLDEVNGAARMREVFNRMPEDFTVHLAEELWQPAPTRNGQVRAKMWVSSDGEPWCLSLSDVGWHADGSVTVEMVGTLPDLDCCGDKP